MFSRSLGFYVVYLSNANKEGGAAVGGVSRGLSSGPGSPGVPGAPRALDSHGRSRDDGTRDEPAALSSVALRCGSLSSCPFPFSVWPDGCSLLPSFPFSSRLFRVQGWIERTARRRYRSSTDPPRCTCGRSSPAPCGRTAGRGLRHPDRKANSDKDCFRSPLSFAWFWCVWRRRLLCRDGSGGNGSQPDQWSIWRSW